ncbi:nitrilase-related carbon-nitrogen hydrolase [Arthrobacter sp. 31Y]|uniref:nitrilase-related carbon-nitrogen hydrolase n=1 Tax=Arthrobacter sp. 31Y TaxID=1115632 RepID=UPI000463D6AC|nr:nitrilase-related carbon-nitrogen hydrolase [Arthrobacter sp. 31Y]
MLSTPTNISPAITAPDVLLIGGGSVIISPLGVVLAGPLRDTEGVLLAEIETDELAGAKFDFDPAGHHTRPDIFSLHIDTAPKKNTVFSSS